mmetsp:Transcript_12074/g.35572  ORF Transcript_12074/g.35572 Transcript_12074/m.35572 type:complete len:297 (-) Transcript_12074:217-1107(-)
MPSTPVPVCCVRIPERILLSTPLPDVDGQLYVLACFEGRPCLPQLIELCRTCSRVRSPPATITTCGTGLWSAPVSATPPPLAPPCSRSALLSEPGEALLLPLLLPVAEVGDLAPRRAVPGLAEHVPEGHRRERLVLLEQAGELGVALDAARLERVLGVLGAALLVLRVPVAPLPPLLLPLGILLHLLVPRVGHIRGIGIGLVDPDALLGVPELWPPVHAVRGAAPRALAWRAIGNRDGDRSGHRDEALCRHRHDGARGRLWRESDRGRRLPRRSDLRLRCREVPLLCRDVCLGYGE